MHPSCLAATIRADGCYALERAFIYAHSAPTSKVWYYQGVSNKSVCRVCDGDVRETLTAPNLFQSFLFWLHSSFIQSIRNLRCLLGLHVPKAVTFFSSHCFLMKTHQGCVSVEVSPRAPDLQLCSDWLIQHEGTRLCLSFNID